MATRKSGKTGVKLFGGPFHGHILQLSNDRTTIEFTYKGYIGRYESGSWRSHRVEPVEDNPNIILGDN